MATRGLLLSVMLLGLAAAPCTADQRAESSMWQAPRQPPAAETQPSSSASGSSSSTRASALQLLRQHPAVFTLPQLGIWSTQLMGQVPLAASAAAALDVVGRHPVPHVARSLAGAVSASLSAVAASVPAPGSTTVLLRHWWRLQCDAPGSAADGAEGMMDLRGLGTAMSSWDWVYHHALTSYVPSSSAALNITDSSSRTTWTLPQSQVVPGIPSGWHIEARGLSPESTFTLSSASGLSRHTHSLDASLCSRPPAVLAPGSMWSVITASHTYEDADLYAHLVAQHTSYHQQLGLSGAILLVTRSVAAQLLTHPALQPGLKTNSYVFILWDGDLVPGTPYYHQSLWHNLVLLATWGVPQLRLAFVDLDEFYVLPRHRTFQEAFSDTGCMAGLAQARLMRLSAYYGVTPAQAAACPDSDPSSHHLPACKLLQRGDSAAAGADAGGAPAAAPSAKARGDVASLAALGWRRFFRQGAQYVDARYTIPESTRLRHRWAHKSFVDPNHVAAYSIHEGGLILPGGGADSQAGLPLSCGFGLHLVNMLKPRMYGEGEPLSLNGSLFHMPTYVEALERGQLYADLAAQHQQQQQHNQQPGRHGGGGLDDL